MLQAEACIIAHPDSALSYLATLENEIKKEPEETQMYYNLLIIKAKDKLYIPHTSDSLIKIITEFYEEYGDNDKLMETYYYLGSTYRDMKDAPSALRAFQDAVDAGKGSKRYNILANAYGQMSNLFAYQGIYDESINTCKKALYYYTLEQEKTKIPIVKRSIARMYASKEKIDSALFYYKEAYKEAIQLNNSNIKNNILGEIGCLYYDLNKLDSARLILQKVLSNNKNQVNVLLNLGLIYKDINSIDSSQYYLNRVLKLGDIYKQRIAYKYLSKIEEDKGKYLNALKYMNKYQQLRDSIDIITQTEAIGQIQALYNYQHIEKENSKLSIKYEKSKVQVYQLLLILIIVIGITSYAIIHIKKKKKKIIDKEKRLRQLKETQYTQSLEYIEDNKKKLKLLEIDLHEIEEEKDTLYKQLIQTQKELLEVSNQQVIVARNEQNLLESSFKRSSIYLLFHKISNNENIKITEDNWISLQIEIDKTYHNFTDKLYSLYPQLSLQELRICYLIKISMQVKEIAQLLNRSKPAISISRTRLYKKIHGCEGSVEMMDQFINDL